MLKAFLPRRRERRERVAHEARILLTFLGEPAYWEARQRAREARGRGEQDGYVFWSKVAVEIADRTGHEIGKEGAARWPEPPPRPDSKRREIADRLVEISRGIGVLSNGQAEPTTLHNIGVAARQVLDFTGRAPPLEVAVEEVITACAAVQLASTGDALAQGVYPPAVEAASRAVQRLRGLALP